MGKTRTTVATQVIRAIEDDRLPNSVRTGLSKALLTEGEIVDNVLDELVSSLGVRTERMYEYAKQGHYTFGLPSGQFTNPGADGKDAVKEVLDLFEGAPATIDYLHWGAPNNLHIAWLNLTKTHGYNPKSNVIGLLTAEKKTPVYLKDLVVVIPFSQLDHTDPFTMEQWGTAARAGFTPDMSRSTLTAETREMLTPTAVEVDDEVSNEYVRVVYTWKNEAGVLETGTFNLTHGYNEQRNYYHVKYTVAGDQIRYWLYEDGSGAWPNLDRIHSPRFEPGGSFMPFTYFRFDKHSEISDTSTAAYKTSKKMLSYLGMDYDTVAESINSNPDITDVQQAMMVFAVPANTTDQLERRYLFAFFNNLYLSQNSADRKASPDAAALEPRIVYKDTSIRTISPSIVVQDRRFRMTLSNRGIYKTRVAGSIGPVGSYNSEFSTKQVSEGPATEYVKAHFYFHQVSTGFYDEICVVGMQTQFHIYGDWTTIGDEDDEILIIPLDHSISGTYSLPDREHLYTRSMHYVFNSLVITKIKWYQTGIFRAVMIIVAIVASVFSYGSAAGAAWGLVAAGGYAAAALIFLNIIIEMVIYALVFKLFVKVVGVKIAFIVAIIAAVMGISSAIEAGSVEGAPFAIELLNASAGISAAIGKQLQNDMHDLLGEFTAQEKYEKEQTQLLDTARQLLNNSVHLDPFVIFGESPNDYYNRTIHSGNIGIIGIDAVSVFVDVKLALPKLVDTLGIEGASI